jgi:hypothetical protein
MKFNHVLHDTIRKIIIDSHSWTSEEIKTICKMYKENKTVEQIFDELPYISLEFIKILYANCLYLDKGNVTGAQDSVSQLHNEIWNQYFSSKSDKKSKPIINKQSDEERDAIMSKVISNVINFNYHPEELSESEYNDLYNFKLRFESEMGSNSEIETYSDPNYKNIPISNHKFISNSNKESNKETYHQRQQLYFIEESHSTL